MFEVGNSNAPKQISLSALFLFLVGGTYLYPVVQIDRRSAPAVRISSAPRIDGRLTDDVWNGLPVLTDFIQYMPYNGKPPSQRTEVKIGYDDRAIYIGAICYDRSADKIKKRVSVRDQWPHGMNVDMFAVVISPYNDGLHSVFIHVSAAGVQRDVKIFGDQFQTTWDIVYETKVKITDFGWVAEMKIPLSALRFTTRPVQDWGLNLWRWIARNREWVVWNFVDINYPGWQKKNGEWKGIKGLRPPLRVSFTPYTSGYLEFDSSYGSEFLYNGGIDIKYGITQSFTLDTTLIPDFGQVQSDDVELNLSPYEIKYNEKRQFFTEGTELFTKGDLFYSRRIGDRPVGYDRVYNEISEDEVVYKNPNETRLINATKLSGRTNFGLGIGIINAMTANTYATVLNQVTGEERQVLTQSFTNYNMIVLDQTLFTHSYISLVNSNTFRKGHSANVTAVDFKFADKTNTYGLNGIYGYSWIRSSYKSQTGYKLLLQGGKIGGILQARYNLSLISGDYDQNDFGYLERNNEVSNQLSLSHRIAKPFACFLDLQNKLQLIYSRAYEPSAFSEFTYNYEVFAEFKNHFVLSLRFEHAPMERRDYYEPRVRGRYFISHKYYKYGISVQTDPRKPLWIECVGDYFDSYDYDVDVSSMLVSLSPYISLNDHLNLGINIAYEKNKNQLGYVDQDFDNGIIYFGKRNRKTVVSTFESSYIFNNKISLTFRLRHYNSKVNYASYFELENNGTCKSSGYDTNHDINVNAFNIDCTLRWNFAPGSEILLNWKNAIYTSDQRLNQNYWQNFTTTLGEPQVNSISLKIIYYFDI